MSAWKLMVIAASAFGASVIFLIGIGVVTGVVPLYAGDCRNLWDGHHTGFEGLIKERLKDPDSMQIISTDIGSSQPGEFRTIAMEYRARNSFGGMVVGKAVGKVNARTCEATYINATREGSTK